MANAINSTTPMPSISTYFTTLAHAAFHECRCRLVAVSGNTTVGLKDRGLLDLHAAVGDDDHDVPRLAPDALQGRSGTPGLLPRSPSIT